MSRPSKAPVIRPPGCGLVLDRPNAAFYGARGGGSAPSYVYVSGVPYTYKQLAEVTGQGRSTVEKKIRKLRLEGREITLELLQKVSSR